MDRNEYIGRAAQLVPMLQERAAQAEGLGSYALTRRGRG
jgi:hypothetical protein